MFQPNEVNATSHESIDGYGNLPYSAGTSVCQMCPGGQTANGTACYDCPVNSVGVYGYARMGAQPLDCFPCRAGKSTGGKTGVTGIYGDNVWGAGASGGCDDCAEGT